MQFPAYCDFFSGSCGVVAEELELEGCEELSLEGAAELDDEDGELVAPEPAVPEPELGAALEDEDAPPALSFFWMSIEVDEELEPDGEVGAAVVPEADEDDEPDGAAVEPDGEVVLEELEAPDGARLLSLRSQPVRAAAPNARETARARVETFMWPPWLGYKD